MFSKKESRNYFISEKLEIRESPGKGLGVFAKKDIKPNEMIESSHVVLFNNQILKNYAKEHDTTHILVNYTFRWENAMSALSLGLGMMYNHSNNPNARWYPSYSYRDSLKRYPHRIQYFSIKEI